MQLLDYGTTSNDNMDILDPFGAEENTGEDNTMSDFWEGKDNDTDTPQSEKQAGQSAKDADTVGENKSLEDADLDDEEKDGESTFQNGENPETKKLEDEKENQEQDGTAEKSDAEKEAAADIELFPQVVDVFGQKRQFTMAQAQQALKDSVIYPLMAKDLAAAQNNPAIKLVEEMAKLAGIGVEEYIASQKMDIEYGDLAADYGGMENIPQSVIKLQNEKMALEVQKISAELEATREREKQREVEEFAIKNPQIKEFPPEVVRLYNEGKTLDAAWNTYSVTQLKQELAAVKEQLAIQQKNSQNRQTQTPRILTGIEPSKSNDPWEAAFL